MITANPFLGPYRQAGLVNIWPACPKGGSPPRQQRRLRETVPLRNDASPHTWKHGQPRITRIDVAGNAATAIGKAQRPPLAPPNPTRYKTQQTNGPNEQRRRFGNLRSIN